MTVTRELGHNLSMQTQRRARFLARLVLVWFVLALGAAIASPLVKPQAMEMVCSSGGALKLVITSDDGKQPGTAHTLDCPLCATPGAPPSVTSQPLPPPSGPGHALSRLPRAHIVDRTAAPLPPRGPPSALS